MRTDAPAMRSIRAIGTTATVVVSDRRDATRAERILGDELNAIDAACSRFRPDSELQHLHDAYGSAVEVSPLLFEAVAVAYAAAQYTSGAVDPTVGKAVEALGYDRDFTDVARNGPEPVGATSPAPGWWQIELDADRRTVRIPVGVHLDLGATAKALVSDRAARRIAQRSRAGVLVSVGGDVSVAGPPPHGGWPIGIAVESSTSVDAVDQVVAIGRGGLATSSTAVRTWRRGGRQLHHIVNPVTGTSALPFWTLVSTTGRNCVEANAAATAAIVWGPHAPARLRALRRPARLVRYDGAVVTVNGWPIAVCAERRTPSTAS